MKSFFIVSYHGSSHNKLDKTLASHVKLQKVERRNDIKTIYWNCHDVIETQKNHKHKLYGSMFYDVCLENYEIASKEILLNYFFIFYLDEVCLNQDSMYLNYRLRRIYEMMHHAKDFIIFFNNSVNFNFLLQKLESKFNLDIPLIEATEYTVRLQKDIENKENYYYNLIKNKFSSNVLSN